MNAYKRGIEGDFGESVLDRVETGFSSIGKGVRARKMVFFMYCAKYPLVRTASDRYVRTQENEGLFPTTRETNRQAPAFILIIWRITEK